MSQVFHTLSVAVIHDPLEPRTMVHVADRVAVLKVQLSRPDTVAAVSFRSLRFGGAGLEGHYSCDEQLLKGFCWMCRQTEESQGIWTLFQGITESLREGRSQETGLRTIENIWDFA